MLIDELYAHCGEVEVLIIVIEEELFFVQAIGQIFNDLFGFFPHGFYPLSDLIDLVDNSASFGDILARLIKEQLEGDKVLFVSGDVDGLKLDLLNTELVYVECWEWLLR